MAKRIILILVILALLGGAFCASYTLSDKYWDKLAPLVGMEETTVPEPETLPVVATPTEAAALPQETTTEPETTLPAYTAATVVEMPTDETWRLILLNRNYQIAETYEPQLAPAIEGSTVQVDFRVAEMFREMYNAAKAEGIELTPVAGYVSTELQTSLYNKKVEELIGQGVAEGSAMFLAAESVLPGGCSEDNIGISVSIGMQLESFAQSEAYQWLKENAWQYGFIERYTAEKKAFTQVSARPWYWRYVGKEAADMMTQSGACLEEYLQK